MAKKDTTELLKLRDAKGEANERFNDFIILLTHGNDGAAFVRKQLNTLMEAERKLAVYEASHKGVVAYQNAMDKKKKDSFFDGLIWPGYLGGLNQKINRIQRGANLKVKAPKRYNKLKK